MKRLLLVLTLVLTCSVAFGADEWSVTDPLGSRQAADIDTYVATNNAALTRMLYNYRRNAKVAYSSASSLSVEAGEIACANVSGAIKMRKNTSAISTSWTVTTNGLDAGAEAASTTYYVYGICDADSDNFTVLISANASAPTGATYYKRLATFTNDGSSNITATSIVNDSDGINDSGSTIYISNPVNLGAQTLSNGSLGRTTTGTTIFNNGTNVTCPTGCYITGGNKQSDSNFTYFNYACP